MNVELSLGFFGSRRAGKTVLLIQITSGHFISEYVPDIEDAFRTCREIDGTKYCLTLIDTSGCEDYSPMKSNYIRTSKGAVVLYSVTDVNSFIEAEKTIRDIFCTKDDDDAPIVLVGNKCDLEDERKIPTEEGESLAAKYGIPFFEISAKTRVNLEEMITTIVREVKSHAEKINNSNTEKQKQCLIQ